MLYILVRHDVGITSEGGRSERWVHLYGIDDNYLWWEIVLEEVNLISIVYMWLGVYWVLLREMVDRLIKHDEFINEF